MFVDLRIKAGVSSCGLFDIVAWYDEKGPKRRSAAMSIPGLANHGSSGDYLALIAPRPLLLTRGLWEWGADNLENKEFSARHVEETRRMAAHARAEYRKLGHDSRLRVVYFDEAGGNHAFPPKVREVAYTWLEQHLQP
jgi:hypothetical protein